MSALGLKVLSGVAVLLLVTGLYFGWQHHQREIGAAKVEASNAKAIAAQNAKDAKLKEALAIKLQARVKQLEDVTVAAGQKIDEIPIEPGSEVDNAAAEAVRCMLDETLCFTPK